MKKQSRMERALLPIYRYFCFFLLMAFVISCCMTLFLNVTVRSMGVELTRDDIQTAAKVTFGNMLFLSLACTAIDAVRRKYTVERPVRRIVSAAEQIMRGDFSGRIPPTPAACRADGLDEIADCFNAMAQELSGIETLRTDFIANVSHELKTPLAVMQNYATLLQQPGLSEEQRLEYARSVGEATRRLSGLIANILKLNKLENQQIFPASHPYNLGEQLCECLLAFEDEWERREIRIDTDIAEDVFVDADPELLSLVWNNLLSNAFKFTQAQGSVTLALKTEGDQAVVRVTDTGCGISPEVGAHIFEKFYQGDTSHAAQGNGLGLALVRRVIDIVGGDVAVQSQVGRGSTFTVKLGRNMDGAN